jgi:hypothetical protein
MFAGSEGLGPFSFMDENPGRMDSQVALVTGYLDVDPRARIDGIEINRFTAKSHGWADSPGFQNGERARPV